MKVSGSRQVKGPAPKRAASAAPAADGAFQPGDGGSVRGLAGLSGPNALTAVDALLAVQESSGAVDDQAGRRKAVSRGEEMLDILEDIKIGLLMGRVPTAKLGRLLRVVEGQREAFVDPQLTEVLDEIELRAKVELAKFGQPVKA